MIVRYIVEQGTISPAADGNWKLTSIPGVSLLYPSSPNAQKFMPAGASLLKLGEDGFANYVIKF